MVITEVNPIRDVHMQTSTKTTGGSIKNVKMEPRITSFVNDPLVVSVIYSYKDEAL